MRRTPRGRKKERKGKKKTPMAGVQPTTATTTAATMDPSERMVAWAEARGVKLNGIAPQRLPGRGVGVLATRNILVKKTGFFHSFFNF